MPSEATYFSQDLPLLVLYAGMSFGSSRWPFRSVAATVPLQQASSRPRNLLEENGPTQIRRAVAIRALGWRLRVLVGLAIRFGPTLP
jgi:hypothetical protein